uniref:G_PROTEIN_RECEP_F1_2 domain-containing protein n=1 Tax=Trichobilharzia regenti TaxID=157069 RepID=A0AA85KBY7_TRIRE|nr:unnamed protein product [Trichobilharzia regenti]
MANRTEWKEWTTPWDTLIDCILLANGDPNTSEVMCRIASVFGVVMGYIFPCVGGFGIITNSIVAFIFLVLLRHETKHFIFLGALALADIAVSINMGWLWFFPSYGLPYISSGSIYYFLLTRSSIVCRLSIFFQTFFCILRGNIYVLLAFDRLFFMHKPLVYNKIPRYYTGILLIVVIILTVLMSLPITLFVDLISVKGLSTCWFSSQTKILPFYQVLFSNTCLIQLTIVALFDVFFLLKVLNWSRSRLQVTETAVKEKKTISPIITLLVLNILSFLFAAPSGITYMILVTYENAPYEYIRMLTFFIYISWILIFLQSSLNILLYFIRIIKFRRVLQKLICCNFGKISNVSKDSTVSSFK